MSDYERDEDGDTGIGSSQPGHVVDKEVSLTRFVEHNGEHYTLRFYCIDGIVESTIRPVENFTDGMPAELALEVAKGLVQIISIARKEGE